MGALIANSNGNVTNYGNTSTVNGNYMTIHCGDTCYITARVNGYFIPQGGSRGYYTSGSTIVSTTVAEGNYGAVIAAAVDQSIASATIPICNEIFTSYGVNA